MSMKKIVFGYPVAEGEILLSDLNKEELKSYLQDRRGSFDAVPESEIVDLVLSWKSLRSFKG